MDESYGDNLPTLPVQRVCVTHVIFFLCDTNLSLLYKVSPRLFSFLSPLFLSPSPPRPLLSLPVDPPELNNNNNYHPL